MKTVREIREFIESLVADGKEILKTEHDIGGGAFGSHLVVDAECFARWVTKCKVLTRLLGDAVTPFARDLDVGTGQYNVNETKKLIAILSATLELIDEGALICVEDLARAEVVGGLVEQAEHLQESGYFLAAGVICRAVLEEHLRNWCDREECTPEKVRPTINDYNQALYNEKHITKTLMKHIDAMASIGNDAAHNKPELTKEDVDRILRDVREFVAKN